jgi:phytoene dehydrogenase-like protein
MRREVPRLKPATVRETAALAGLGLRLRGLGKDDMREFLRIIGQNMYDELESRLDDVYLKAALGFDATLGTHTAPRSPGNCLNWLYRLAGRQGQLRLPVGGVNALADALQEKARELSVEIRTDAAVERIIVDNGRVTGVQVNGELVDSFRVLSSLGARTTMLGLTGAEHFETEALRRVRHVRAEGNVARLHLALDGLPHLPDNGSARYVIAGKLEDVERAFNPVKYGALGQTLTAEFSLPSVTTPNLAPTGRHVLAANIQFVPYALRGGWTNEAKAILLDRSIDCLADKVPGLREHIVHSEVLTPVDLENHYGVEGGHWHQAELSLDQFLFVRPFVGAAQYQLPLEGLYLCGAAAHPGGGISTLPGQLAARSMLKRGAAR